MNSKVFEDNNGAIKLAKAPKIRPRTKHIALKYHYFRYHVRKGLITVYRMDTHEQVAGILKKALRFPIFNYLRKNMMGWSKQ